MANAYLKLKTEREKAHTEMVRKFKRAHEEAIENDKTGEGFIFDMFSCELANHEYTYTGDIKPALTALGLTIKMVNKDKRFVTGLKKAIACAYDPK